jgi:tetratricopeptide (TPR) repeat protein
LERYSRGWRDTIADLAPELDNLRAAADWAAEGDPQRELQLVGALAWFWIAHTTVSEAEERLSAALARPAPRTAPRARATHFAALAAASRGKVELAVPLYEEALGTWRKLRDAEHASLTLDGLGQAYLQGGEDELARRSFEEGLELRKQLGRPDLVRRSLLNICQLIVSSADVDQAEPIAEDLHRRAVEASDWTTEQFALHFLADCPLIRRDYPEAERRYARAARFAWEHGNRFQCVNEMQGVAMAVSGGGDYPRALGSPAPPSRSGSAEEQPDGSSPSGPGCSTSISAARRAALGSEAAAAEAEGRTVPFERAFEEAVRASPAADPT